MSAAVLNNHRMVRNGSWWTCMFCPHRVAFPSPWPLPAGPCVPRAWWPELEPGPDEPRCPAHGDERCPRCSLNGPCDFCSYYAATGMHWDTCPNRVLAEAPRSDQGRKNEQREINRISRRLLHTSMHNKIPIWIAGRIQEDVNELRRTASLPEFGWGDFVPDEEVKRCTVHTTSDCEGQHMHSLPLP